MRRAVRVLPLIVLLVAAAVLVFTNQRTGDYVGYGTPPPGRAGPGLDALAHGDLDGFFSLQSLMGLGTILLRLPVVWAARQAGADTTLTYQLGAFTCLLGPVALGAWLYGDMARRGAGAAARWVLAVLCVVNPFVWHGLISGHPEEAMAASLAVVAVLVVRHRPLLGGVLAGLAAGTKQWALLVVPVVMAVASRRRLLLGAVGLGVAALLLFPGPIGDPDRAAFVRGYAGDLRLINELNLWWPLGNVISALGSERLGTHFGVLPAGLERDEVAPLVPLVALALALLFVRRGGAGATAERALALLALVLLVRCALDPSNLSYYEIAPFLAVCAWEATARTRLPWVSLAVAAGYWLVFQGVYTRVDPSLAALAYVAVTGPLAWILWRAAFPTEPRAATRG